MNNGWISIHRGITQHWLWNNKPFSKNAAWIDLLLLANYEDKKTSCKGEIVTCRRGDVNISILSLADRWGWDRKKVKRFLTALENDSMVIVNATTHRTTITIVNYDKFQDSGTAKGATNSQQVGQQSPITNNINKDNNKETHINMCKENKSAKEVKHKHGEYNNVLLTDNELEKLKAKFPGDCNDRIEEMSLALKTYGYKYKSHYHAILTWARKSDKKTPTNTETHINEKQRSGYVRDFTELI